MEMIVGSIRGMIALGFLGCRQNCFLVASETQGVCKCSLPQTPGSSLLCLHNALILQETQIWVDSWGMVQCQRSMGQWLSLVVVSCTVWCCDCPLWLLSAMRWVASATCSCCHSMLPHPDPGATEPRAVDWTFWAQTIFFLNIVYVGFHINSNKMFTSNNILFKWVRSSLAGFQRKTFIASVEFRL